MRILSDGDAIEWCLARGLTIADGLPSSRVQISSQTLRVRISTKGSAHELAGLVYTLLLTQSLPRDEGHFEGALVWLQRWQLWSESVDRIGYLFLNKLRGAELSTADFAESPAQLFAPKEFVEATACLFLLVTFQWDAYLIDPNGRMVAFISHEEHIDLLCARDEDQVEVMERFKEWNPIEISGPA
jgi:hypothetical protein